VNTSTAGQIRNCVPSVPGCGSGQAGAFRTRALPLAGGPPHGFRLPVGGRCGRPQAVTTPDIPGNSGGWAGPGRVYHHTPTLPHLTTRAYPERVVWYAVPTHDGCVDIWGRRALAVVVANGGRVGGRTPHTLPRVPRPDLHTPPRDVPSVSYVLPALIRRGLVTHSADILVLYR